MRARVRLNVNVNGCVHVEFGEKDCILSRTFFRLHSDAITSASPAHSFGHSTISASEIHFSIVNHDFLFAEISFCLGSFNK